MPGVRQNAFVTSHSVAVDARGCACERFGDTESLSEAHLLKVLTVVVWRLKVVAWLSLVSCDEKPGEQTDLLHAMTCTQL